MNMKLSNSIKSLFKNEDFDLDHESKMAQARILSTFLEIIENNKQTQSDLAELTGLKQPFLSGLFNQRRKLSMNHIALLQKALKVKLEPPTYLSDGEHFEKHYSIDEYEPASSYFTESLPLKNKCVVSWVNSRASSSIIKDDEYSVIESGSLHKLSKERIKA
ncbi:MAG: transcriptional regulator with XRE-family HTH domain [Vicingaceae bacterium]|jgi:transcriptional regulator with XRE-family HTH domain